nr:hypothetical protein CFP56_54350 [Quercus suber]
MTTLCAQNRNRAEGGGDHVQFLFTTSVFRLATPNCSNSAIRGILAPDNCPESHTGSGCDLARPCSTQPSLSMGSSLSLDQIHEALKSRKKLGSSLLEIDLLAIESLKPVILTRKGENHSTGFEIVIDTHTSKASWPDLMQHITLDTTNDLLPMPNLNAAASLTYMEESAAPWIHCIDQNILQ